MVRRSFRGSSALGFLATAPIAIPGIVIGVGLFLSYANPTFMLYGTLWILFIAFVTIEMPAGYQQMSSAMSGVHSDLEEASRIFGASRLRTLWLITAPLLKTSLVATWCFVFIGTIRELSATEVGGRRHAAEQAASFLAANPDAYLIATRDRLKELALYVPQDVGIVEEAPYFLKEGERLVVLGRNGLPLGIVSGREEGPMGRKDLR